MVPNISTVKINASFQKVWDLVTKPRFVKLWQYGSDLLTTWEIGSDLKFRIEWEEKICSWRNFNSWSRI